MTGPNVLVIDDQQPKIAAIVGCLLEAGLCRDDIHVVQSSSAAREMMVGRKFDLVVVDLAIPKWPEDEPDRLGGLKLLKEAIERDHFNLPSNVIGLTQHEDLHRDLMDEFRSQHWSLDQYDIADSGWMARLKAKAEYLLRVARQPERPKFQTDLAVITARPIELRALRQINWEWGSQEALDETTFVHRGTVPTNSEKLSVVATSCPRMGMVAAALLAMKIIVGYRPRLLAMIGMCAGVRGECSIGDILLADPSWDWQCGKHNGETFLAAPDQLDVALEIRQRFEVIGEDRHSLLRLHDQFAGPKPNSIPSIRVGPVASGSSVLADGEMIQRIKQDQHRALLGIEMEQYGVYAAAKDVTPPRPFAFGIKSVVDFADGEKNDNFQPYGAYASANVLRLFVERFGEELVRLP